MTDKTKMRKAAKTGRESIIYDEAKINLRPSAAYNNTTYTNSQQGDVSYTNTDSFSAAENRSALQRSYTMPPPACVRQSAQYVNTMSSEQDFRWFWFSLKIIISYQIVLNTKNISVFNLSAVILYCRYCASRSDSSSEAV